MKRLSLRAAVQSNPLGTYLILPLIVLPLGLGFGSFVPGWFCAQGLAYALGLPGDPRVIDHPVGWLWLVLVVAVGVLLMLGGCLLGFLLDALILRFALGWSWKTVAGSGVCPGDLVLWLEGHLAGSRASQEAERDTDPMYDPELDDTGRPPLPSGRSDGAPRRWDR